MEFGVSKEKTSIIKGKHTYEEVLSKLDSFIEKYLLCPKCELPEISLFSDKDVLKGKCRACGNAGKLDNSHKLTGYIIKNMPKDMSEITVGDTVEVEKSTKKKGKKSKKTKEEIKEEEEPEEEVITADSEHIIQAAENIRDYIKDKADALKLDELKDEIHNQCISARATQDLKYFIVFNGLFSANVLNEFARFKDLLRSMVAADKKDGAKFFIMTMVRFFVEKHPKLAVAIPTFLHHVYEAEILDEAVLLKWDSKKFKTDKNSSLYNKKNEKAFKKSAEKFFTWLKEAEEDESEEDEDEEEQKEELTEQQLKEKQMKELIEQDIKKQEQELAEIKQKQAEEKKVAEELAIATGKIDLGASNKDEEEFNFDDI